MATDKLNPLKVQDALRIAADSLPLSPEDRADMLPRYEQRLISYCESLSVARSITPAKAVDEFLLRSIDSGLRALAHNPELNTETRYQHEDSLADLYDFLSHPR